LFKKKVQKECFVSTDFADGGWNSQSKGQMKYDELLDYLRFYFEQQGDLVISFTDKNKLEISSLRTVKFDKVENKLQGINNLIRNYINKE
jgi:hypothetical protein